jgi:hypothetical protein
VIEPVVLDSARKHGVTDEDMVHAWRNAIRIFEVGDGMTMFIGAGRDGTLLEVGVVRPRGTGWTLIAHAMRARARYLG